MGFGPPQGLIALEPELEQVLAQEHQDLGLAANLEVAGPAQLDAVLAHQPVPEGVEGGDRGADEPIGHQHVHARLHLRGGLVGEGEGEDLLRAGALGGDQPGDAAGDHLGLAGAGPGHDQQRPFAVRDRPVLLRVEALEDGLEPRRPGPGGLHAHRRSRGGRRSRGA